MLYLFADGQKIAKKLCTQITKETKVIKSLLPEYNACQATIGEDSSALLSMEEVLDSSLLSMILRPHSNFSNIPSKTKQEIMDASLHMERASEEITMLEKEMSNMISYYKDRSKVLYHSIQLFMSREDGFGRGVLSLLKTMAYTVNIKLQECVELFKFTNADSGMLSDSDDSDSDADFSYESD